MSGREEPRSLEEAYALRDAAATPGEWEFYQERVYRLRAQEYLHRGVVTKKSVRRRERRRIRGPDPQAEPQGIRRLWRRWISR